ncbi:hypothetical protein JVX93_13680 [Mycolicibacterium boenickei]|nr:hypothetical protein JVX93_13680 [Mycolicibacterium boenickei]
MQIKGAQALVTGAAGGLGGTIARAPHGRGARLILTGQRAEPLHILARLAGLAPGFTARLTRRDDALAWGDRVSEGLRHLR